jgi:VCBS repeat-containing protein
MRLSFGSTGGRMRWLLLACVPGVLAWTGAAHALTEQDFEGAAGGYELLNVNGVDGAPAAVLDEGGNAFLRLAPGGPTSHNTITFSQVELAAPRVVADFEFRITPVTGAADGIAFAFLNTAEYPAAAVPPAGVAEEPNFAGSIAVAFDVWPSGGEPGEQHLSIHYGGRTYAFGLAMSDAHLPEIATSGWFAARVSIDFEGDSAKVSVAIRGLGTRACSVVEGLKLSGVPAYDGKAWFGARAGGVLSHFDLDDVRVAASAPSETGSFTSAECLPAIPIHASLLPNSEILFWDRHDYTMDAGPFLLEPMTGHVEMAAHPGFDAFCAGHTFLGDELFTAGGHFLDGVGTDDAVLYDYREDHWRVEPPLNDGRWYPTVTAIGRSSAVVMSGTIDPFLGVNLVPEVYDRDSGSFRQLSTAELALPLYPWAYPVTDNRVFVAGPQQQARFLDTTGTGAWSLPISSTRAFRDYGSSVTHAPGKVLIAGGSACSVNGDCLTGGGELLPPTNSVELIDLTSETPAFAAVAPMHHARRQFSLVTLPDGSVLAIGGTASGTGNDGTLGVRAPEIWDPAANTWTLLEPMMVTRIYHHTALLLPDARVFVAGGGHPLGPESGDQSDYEILSPPYLHTGRPRPQIGVVSPYLEFGESFRVYGQSVSAPTFTLVRLGAITHGFNQSQGVVPNLPATPVDGLTGAYDVALPDVSAFAAPGPYLLFMLDDGVPSIAAIVTVQGPRAPDTGGGEGGASGAAGEAGAESGGGGASQGGHGGQDPATGGTAGAPASGGAPGAGGSNGGAPSEGGAPSDGGADAGGADGGGTDGGAPSAGTGGDAADGGTPGEGAGGAPAPTGGSAGSSSNPDENHPPIPQSTTLIVAAGASADGTLTAVDLDTGDTLRFSLPDPAEGELGTLSLSTNGSFTYTAKPTSGTDVRRFSVSDGEASRNGTLTIFIHDAATVPPHDHGGCGCRLAPERNTSQGLGVAAAFALLALMRRRASARRHLGASERDAKVVGGA